MLYNSLEGLTSLWDLGSGEVVGKFESYARQGQPDDVEPCEFSCLLSNRVTSEYLLQPGLCLSTQPVEHMHLAGAQEKSLFILLPQVLILGRD